MRNSFLVLLPLLLGATSPQSTPPSPSSTQAPSKPPAPSTPPAGQSTTQTPPPSKPAEGQPATPPAGQAPAADAAKTGADAAKGAAEAKFDAAHLEQIVAPIALHPDGLLSQILMASTYPLEIVEAARWREKNATLKEKALEDALKNQDWDASVKSLCGFPSVLKQMNENLDWTQDLGDAFLGQKTELMDAVQRMRKKAMDAGQLKTTDQQKVSQEGQYIVVQSTNPEVIYVPTYSPTVVYGGWAYPTYYYPPMYTYPPAGYGFMSFTAGVVWGAAIFGNCNWGGSDVDIDINNQNNFNGRTDSREQREQRQNDRGQGSRGDRAGTTDRSGAKGGKESFKHNPEHRKGVNYKDSGTAGKFGGDAGSKRVSQSQARGRTGGSPSAGTRPSSPSSRPSGAGAGASSRPSAGTRPTTSGAGSRSSSRPSASSSGSKSSAFSGSRSAGMDRAASSRGSASRSGGGSRGGGGGRGGGGRGGGRR